MPVELSCAMDLSIAPESGFWSMFLVTQEPSLAPKGLASHHAAGDRQGDHQAAKRDAGILWTRNFITRMLTWDFRVGRNWGSIFSRCSIKSKQQQKYCKIQSSDRGG